MHLILVDKNNEKTYKNFVLVLSFLLYGNYLDLQTQQSESLYFLGSSIRQQH